MAALRAGGVTGTQMFGTEADGATDTALDLADGNASATAGCKAAKDARGDAWAAWLQAKKARRRVQRKLREADSPKREAKLGEKLQRKRKLVAKRRGRAAAGDREAAGRLLGLGLVPARVGQHAR